MVPSPATAFTISIHALRAEGDGCLAAFNKVSSISIHALRAEGDVKIGYAAKVPYSFLSTPSVRRATFHFTQEVAIKEYFYPRPPCGGRPAPFYYAQQ